MNPDRMVKPDPRRRLPPVDRLVRELGGVRPDLPVWARTAAARQVLQEARDRIARSEAGDESEAALLRRASALAAERARPHPAPVVNATGIVLHTNLGRAPLAGGAARAVAEAAQGYTDLELDLSRGERGQRSGAVVEKLRLLSGAGDALVVNNNAAAIWLVLASLAAGREAIVSRGELVEIGGSFRVPEILGAAGVRLVEVGTTNRTHPEDYESAIGPGTALLLKVHRSNFSQTGFVSEVSLRELGVIGRARGLPVVEDLGAGTLVDLGPRGLPVDAFAPARLRQGGDFVCFSGDKLVGGPQCGIVLAREPEGLGPMRRSPLMRALRLDKLALAALDWTLAAHLEGRAESEIPVLRQLLTAPEVLEPRARALAERIADARPDSCVEVLPDRTFAGGGSLPGFELATWVVSLRPEEGATRCAAALLRAAPPVLARVRGNCVLFDLRTLVPEDERHVAAALGSTPD